MKSLSRTGSICAALVVSLAVAGTQGCKKDPNVEKQKYLESGQRYVKDGKYREAGIQFSNALKVDRNFADAHYALSKVYLQLGNPMSAYQELMRTVDLNPANVNAHLDLGTLLVAGGVPDRAMDQAKIMLAANPNNADAYGLRAQVYDKKGDHAAALVDVQHALALDPNRSKFHEMLAILQASGSGGTPDQARGELEKAVSLDPANVNARIGLARLLLKSGNRAGAEQQLQDAIKQAPKSVGLRAALSGFYIDGGDKTRAEQVLQQTVSDMPDEEAAVGLLRNYYLRNNQGDRARSVFEQLSRDHSKSVALRVAYAQVLLQGGDVAKAQSVVDDLSKTNAKNPQVEVLNAFLLLQAHKTDEAYAALQKSTRNAPDNVQLQLMLGDTAYKKKDLSAAEAAFHAAARLDPSSLPAQKGLATIASQRGDSSLLAQVAESTISLHPDYADAYLWRGTASANQKQYAHAEADFQTALKLDPNNATALAELGEARLLQGKTADGQALLEQAVNHDPNAARPLDLLIRSDLQAKQPQRAVSRVEAAIAKAPGNAQLYTTLAILQLSLKNFTAARDASAKAMQMNPSMEDAVQAYAQAQAALGQPDQAVAAWQHWSTAHPTDSKALLLLGTLAESNGDFAKAMEYYRKSLELAPNLAPAANNLAYLMVESGQNADVALNYAQIARRGMPESPTTADTLAWVYFHKGTFESARDLLEDAAKQAPENAAIQYHLGMTYAKLGDKTNAGLHLKRAVSLGPDSKTGKEASTAVAQLG